VSRRVDVITVGLALTVHAAFAATLIRRAAHQAPRRPIEVEFKRTPPPPAEPPKAAAATPPAAPKPPAIRHHLAMRSPTPPARAPEPAPAAHARTPARVPMPPVFGVAMSSVSEVGGSVAVPIGGTTNADPAGPRAGARAPAGAPSGAPGDHGYAPASELDVKTMPDVDADACGRTVSYPPEAEREGVEGDVRLRVSLDDTGHVHGVHVLSGLGHGLDQAAVEAIKHRCRFTPALSRDGRAVAFVIQSYTFHFELPR
jgi:protein TonB